MPLSTVETKTHGQKTWNLGGSPCAVTGTAFMYMANMSYLEPAGRFSGRKPALLTTCPGPGCLAT